MKEEKRKVLAEKYLNTLKRYKRANKPIPFIGIVAKNLGVPIYQLKTALNQEGIPYKINHTTLQFATPIEIDV